MLVALQQLVTAAGAVIEGVRATRGQWTADLIARTALRQSVPLLGGSVTVEFEPEASPASELVGKQGVALIDQPMELFVDRSVREAILLLQEAHNLGPDIDQNEFVTRLLKGGPRFASVVRRFAKAVTNSDFEVETTWAQPHQAAIRAIFTVRDAALVEQIIKGRRLDEESVVLVGRVYTSSVALKWQLDLGEGAVVPLDLSRMGEDPDFVHLPPTQRVRVEARVQIREALDGTQARTYLVDSITPITDADDTDATQRTEIHGRDLSAE